MDIVETFRVKKERVYLSNKIFRLNTLKIINYICFWTLLLSVVALTMQVFAQKTSDASARITTWYQNKPGAISITFDDAGYSQYVSAYPVLEKHNIKATFGIVGEWVGEEPQFTAEEGYFEIKRMGWPQLIELFDHGHELSAHGYHHQKYDKGMPVPELSVEMGKIKSLIESRTQSTVYTMNYPYSYASGNILSAAIEAGYLFGRTGLDTINPPSPQNMYLLATQAILNESLPDSITFHRWLDEAKGNWLILMYHHFFEKNSKEISIIQLHDVIYSYSVYPEIFERQMEEMVATNYWIAPVSTIGKYISERDGTDVKIIRGRKIIYIFTITNLNKNIYNQPLTLEVTVPWKRVGIRGSRNDGIVEVSNNKLYIDILPEKEVIITKE
jgi:peptidoglycan/xylan/chitin deacetylase (PgdA/CDA1 family)